MNIGEASARIGSVSKDHSLFRSGRADRDRESSAGGYRVYTQADAHVPRFIKRARHLRFSTAASLIYVKTKAEPAAHT